MFVGAEILRCHGYTYDASYSELKSIPTDIPSNVTSVKLNNNLIINVTSGVFSHLSQCKNIHLSYNKLLLIQSGAFTGLQGLTHLELSKNLITQTINSSMWIGLQYVEYLGLHDNHIPSISPGAFSGLTFLKTLYLSRNRISEINGNMWVGLQFLEVLTLNEMRIREIPRHGISHVPSLNQLHFKKNLIRTLRADMFNPDIKEHHPTLYLNMDGNSALYCDSGLCWLKEAVKFGSLSLYGVRCVPSVAFQHVELNCTLGKHCSLFLVSSVSLGFIIVGSLEAAYSLNLGAREIWGKGGGETLALL